MKITYTYKEAAKILKEVLNNWEQVSFHNDNPDGFCYGSDHCHGELLQAEEVVERLSKMEGYLSK